MLTQRSSNARIKPTGLFHELFHLRASGLLQCWLTSLTARIQSTVIEYRRMHFSFEKSAPFGMPQTNLHSALKVRRIPKPFIWEESLQCRGRFDFEDLDSRVPDKPAVTTLCNVRNATKEQQQIVLAKPKRFCFRWCLTAASPADPLGEGVKIDKFGGFRVENAQYRFQSDAMTPKGDRGLDARTCFRTSSRPVACIRALAYVHRGWPCAPSSATFAPLFAHSL